MINNELYSWVLRGTQRTAVIRVMDRVKIPTGIRKDALEFDKKISIANVSRVLRGFVERGIAICLNNENRTGRLYTLTEKGDDIRNHVLNIKDQNSLLKGVLKE